MNDDHVTQKDVKELWTWMAQTYGPLWREYGDTPLPAWSQELTRLTRAELHRGVRAVMKSGERWPPTLPEFVGMCRRQRPPAIPYVAPVLALEKITRKVSEPRPFEKELGELKKLLEDV